MRVLSPYMYLIHIHSESVCVYVCVFSFSKHPFQSIQLGPDVKIACFFIYASSFYSTPCVC